MILILYTSVCSRGISVLAAEEGEKSIDSLYLSDVKRFYAENEEQARKLCEAEGYIFSPQNLTEGAGFTYISDMQNLYDTWYKQSAISFIRLIMNSASVYQEAMQKRETYGDAFGYNDLSTDSTMDDLLAKDPNCKVPEYVNAILVYNLFDGIIYQEAGETVTTDTAYLNEGEEGAEAAAPATTTFTEQKTLAKYFLELAADPELAQYLEKVYPFIEAMTSPQRTAMELCGIGNLAKGLYPEADYSGKRDSSIAEAAAKIREAGFADGKIYLWEGLDTSIYDLKTVETSDAIEIEKSGTAIFDFINAEARKKASTLSIALQITDFSMAAVSGLVMVVKAIAGVGLYEVASACFFMSSLAMAGGLTGAGILYTIGGILAGCLWVLNIAMLVVSLCYMVYMILDACGAFDEHPTADFSIIPNIVFHVKQNSTGTYRVRYDAVCSNASSEYFTDIFQRNTALADYEIRTILQVYSYTRSDVSDFGIFAEFNDRWISPFISRSPAAGKPIRISSEGTFFKLLDDNNAPDGYRPVTLVSNSQTADIHSINFGNDIKLNSAYLYVYSESAAPSVPDEEKTPEEGKETPEEEKKPEEEKEDKTSEQDKEKEDGNKETNTAQAPAGSYITRVRLSHASNREDAMNRLKSNGYLDIIDVNLTPYDGYTFLGFQYGSTNAITDIRVGTTGASSMVIPHIQWQGMPEPR